MHWIYGFRKISWQHTACSARFTFNKIDALALMEFLGGQVAHKYSLVCLHVQYTVCVDVDVLRLSI